MNLTAMNPTAPIESRAAAVDAARASAIAIAIGVVWGLFGLLYMLTGGQAAMQAAVAQAAADSPEAAAMAGAMGGVAIGMIIFFIVIQAILGLVQWFKPNIVIPIIFIILVIYGLGTAVLGLMMAGSMPAGAASPMWLTVGGFVVMVVELILHIAGARGASKIKDFEHDLSDTF